MNAPATDAVTYMFSNDSDHSQQLHDGLKVYNPVSTGRIKALANLKGARVLEIGAGAGSMSRWFGAQVGEDGLVQATDINPLFGNDMHARVRCMQHNVLTDTIPEPETWDFIYARAVIGHLSDHAPGIIARLTEALKPGGILLIEDLRSQDWEHVVAYTSQPRDAELLRTFISISQRVLARHGVDRRWPFRAYDTFRKAGLLDVRTERHTETWPGDGPGTKLVDAALAQMRDEIVNVDNFPAEDLDRVQELLADPRIVLHGHDLFATSGRRAE
jgi:2-polyprenyl-3-methyl-5-hydroxy-6-metoxy-1,4-benzoquinol methylase